MYAWNCAGFSYAKNFKRKIPVKNFDVSKTSVIQRENFFIGSSPGSSGMGLDVDAAGSMCGYPLVVVFHGWSQTISVVDV